MKRLAWAAALAVVAIAPAFAHGDEDHGQDRTPAPAIEAGASGLSGAAGASDESASPRRRPDGSLFVPKAVQRRLGLRTLVARVAQVAQTVEFNGKVIADLNASGRVQAAQAGRVEAGPHGLPTLGQSVAKGQVLAWVVPTSDRIERGNQQAQLAEIESLLAIAEAKAARYEQLEGSVPRKDIEAVRLELVSLKRRRAAVDQSLHGREALRSPVTGVLSAGNVVAGQIVEPREILFEIVDPKRLAVEALAYDASSALGIREASAAVPGGSFPLQFVGSGRQLREQAVPLLFRVREAGVALAIGQPLKVIATTDRTIEGVAIPRRALVRNGAETIVWVHTAAETFAPRSVRFESLDADSVAVTAGIASRERIVTDAAGLLSQVR